MESKSLLHRYLERHMMAKRRIKGSTTSLGEELANLEYVNRKKQNEELENFTAKNEYNDDLIKFFTTLSAGAITFFPLAIGNQFIAESVDPDIAVYLFLCFGISVVFGLTGLLYKQICINIYFYEELNEKSPFAYLNKNPLGRALHIGRTISLVQGLITISGFYFVTVYLVGAEVLTRMITGE